MCTNFLKTGKGWALSEMGDVWGCLVACEVIKHHTVLRSDSPDTSSEVLSSPSPQLTDVSFPLKAISLLAKLPKHYVLVKNDSHVRVGSLTHLCALTIVIDQILACIQTSKFKRKC